MKKKAAQILIAIVIVLGYFLLWRPVRVATTQHVVQPIVQKIVTHTASGVQIRNTGGVSFQISWGSGDHIQTIGYRPQTGFFFLVALLSLLFITFEWKWYLYLLAFHLGSFLFVFANIIFGLYGFHLSFLVAELMIVYLIPVFSMAYIPWLIYYKRRI